MDKTILYWLPRCSTCQKAAKYLADQGVAIEVFRDLKSERLSREEIENLAAIIGGTEKLFSRRAIKYRELKLNERDLTEREMAELMMEEYTFIKRPVFVFGGRGTAGFAEKEFQKILRNK